MAVSQHVDRPIRGWKTYCLYKPMNPPSVAPLYDRFPSGAEIPADVSPHRLIEPEIMFRVDRDLPARDRNYDVVEIRESVTAVVGFEVIGSRFRGAGQGSLYSSLSDHIANGAIVVGDAVPQWREVAFEDVALRLTEGDRELIAVVGAIPSTTRSFPSWWG